MTYVIAQDEAYAKLYGGAKEFWGYKGREVILHGPYETGKTFAVLTKLHALLCKYKHSQALAVRKTYKSLISSVCVTFDNKVMAYPPTSPNCPIIKYGGEKPDFYLYPNGSRLWLGGLDNPDKFLSAEFDFVYVNQAEEIELDHWETLTGRASGRAGNTPYTQVMGDCNPGPPGHWILSRFSAGKLNLVQQMHEHNPTLFHQETGEITEQGKITMATLDALTGVRYQRGRLGLWVQAEGVVYDNFDLNGNVTTDAEYNPAWPVFWGGDDGYAFGQGSGTESYHPRVVLLGQQTPIGGLNIFAAYYRTGVTSYDTTIDELLKQPYALPELAYVDSSAAMFRGALWNRGINTMGATHVVTEGIRNLRRLICDGAGMRLLKIHPRCEELIRELQSYRYTDTGVSMGGEPKPMKLDDHGPDALRYLSWRLRFNG